MEGNGDGDDGSDGGGYGVGNGRDIYHQRNLLSAGLLLRGTGYGPSPYSIVKGAGAFEAPGQTMDELSAIDTSRYPRVLKTGPNHGCQ